MKEERLKLCFLFVSWFDSEFPLSDQFLQYLCIKHASDHTEIEVSVSATYSIYLYFEEDLSFQDKPD